MKGKIFFSVLVAVNVGDKCIERIRADLRIDDLALFVEYHDYKSVVFPAFLFLCPIINGRHMGN